MNFVSPCSLSSFIKMCNIVETKSIFPYQHFRSIAELEECEDFPEYDAFYSDLKSGHTCTFEEYELAKLEFDIIRIVWMIMIRIKCITCYVGFDIIITLMFHHW